MMKLFLVLIFASQLALGQDSPHGKISLPCETCHSTDTWRQRPDAAYNHNSTGFPLQGRHRLLRCISCHANLLFTNLDGECRTCHLDVHKAELGTDCLRCHTMDSWIIPDMLQKHEQTRFPLLGRHRLAGCSDCHDLASSHRFGGTPMACISCHRSEYQATSAPSHVEAGFATDCRRCHAVDAMTWPSGFDHNLTAFPLTGAHRTVLCPQCHVNNQFRHIPADCYSCHANAYATAQSPNHVAGSLSRECRLCHTTVAWTPSTFDHSTTAFPLTGQHRTTSCQQCHTGGNYQLRYSGCVQCHLSDYQQSTNPNHLTSNIGQTCDVCHSTAAWRPATFDHSASRFPLTGSHVAVACISCHVGNNYQLAYLDCYQCHAADYERPTDPNHVAANFAHDCTPCHTTTSWSPSTFNHAATSFPLTGKHVTTSCQACHVGGNYQLKYSDCYACHQAQYAQPSDPNHVSANFPHDCSPCHTTTAWSPSTFDHDGPYFKIYSGAHRQRWTTCADCHTNPASYTQYSCITCHQHAQSVTDPQHTDVTGYVYSSPACYNCHRGI